MIKVAHQIFALSNLSSPYKIKLFKLLSLTVERNRNIFQVIHKNGLVLIIEMAAQGNVFNDSGRMFWFQLQYNRNKVGLKPCLNLCPQG